MISAAIQIGTEHNCFAVMDSSKQISVPTAAFHRWPGMTPTDVTSTCVLVNPQSQFDSFGFDAERKFWHLKENGEHRGWMMFEPFKSLVNDFRVFACFIPLFIFITFTKMSVSCFEICSDYKYYIFIVLFVVIGTCSSMH